MGTENLDLMARFVCIAAVTLAACGLFLIFLDVGRAPESSGLRRRLTKIWNNLGATPIAEAPTLAIGAAMKSLDRFVVYWFEQSERNVATAGAFTLIVFVAIPIASLMNWLRGGSPVLVILMASCVVGLLVLAILSEMKRIPAVSRVLAPLLFGAVFLFVPIYVFVSLTDRALNIPIGHGALTSMLIAPLLYLICHSAILLGMGTYAAPVTSIRASDIRRVATLFTAFVPLAYLGAFAAFLIWHVAAPELPEPSTWRTLMVVIGCSALAAAIAVHLATGRSRRKVAPLGLFIRLGAGAALAGVLSLMIMVVGKVSFDGPRLLVGLPFVVPVILTTIAASALLAKMILAVMQTWAGGETVFLRPYRIAGILTLILAVGAGWAALS